MDKEILLDDLKLSLRIDGDDDDRLLNSYIKAAEVYIKTAVGGDGQLPQSKDMGLVTHDLTVSGNNATSLLPHYTWLHHWVV
ncbi:head-tail connector protein, partial [Ligilactobacillus salivarius]|uniref:head-tail connector protein n=1 Tax=Ligilactobacillus salivarius TaxID=1624 RepID=UPI001CDBEBC1